MKSPEDGGKVIQFPRQKSGADLRAENSVDPDARLHDDVGDDSLYAQARERLLAQAQELADKDGEPVDFDPIAVSAELQRVITTPVGSYERHEASANLEAYLRESLEQYHLSIPIVIYAITLSRYSGPGLYHLVRYEGLLLDATKPPEAPCANWDEVLNSDVDVDEEPADIPADFNFLIIDAVHTADGSWKIKPGSIANEIPFARVLAIRCAKTPIPRPRTV